MKKILIIAALVVLTTLNSTEARPGMNVDFNYFYHTLAPHGEWISLDGDLVVWRPTNVHYDWQPYSIGQWSWTQDGWYWGSNEPFGWATYHYGRWMYEDYYGWVWLPDYDWAPAWVEWRYDNDYIGWSPLPAYASFHIDLGIHFSMSWRSHYSHWNFVRYNHFCHQNVHNHFMGHRYVNNFFSRTKYRTNYHQRNNRIFNGGIDRNFVERRGGYKVVERRIARSNSLEDYNRDRSRDDGSIRSYRPSGKELKRYEGRTERNFTRGSRTSSLQKDKVVIGSRSKNIRGDNGVDRNGRQNKLERSREITKGSDKRTNDRITGSRIPKSQNSDRKKLVKRESRKINKSNEKRMSSSSNERKTNSSSKMSKRTNSPRIERKQTEVKRERTTSANSRIKNRQSSSSNRGTKSQSQRQSASSKKKVERKGRR